MGEKYDEYPNERKQKSHTKKIKDRYGTFFGGNIMVSKLFVTEIQRKIEDTIVNLLNNNQLMNYNTVNSPRAVGDAVQGFLDI